MKRQCNGNMISALSVENIMLHSLLILKREKTN